MVWPLDFWSCLWMRNFYLSPAYHYIHLPRQEWSIGMTKQNDRHGEGNDITSLLLPLESLGTRGDWICPWCSRIWESCKAFVNSLSWQTSSTAVRLQQLMHRWLHFKPWEGVGHSRSPTHQAQQPDPAHSLLEELWHWVIFPEAEGGELKATPPDSVCWLLILLLSFVCCVTLDNVLNTLCLKLIRCTSCKGACLPCRALVNPK